MAALTKRIQHAAAWRSRRAMVNMRHFKDSFSVYLNRRRVEPVQVDPRIKYPCYKSLDEHIDVEKFGTHKKSV